MYPSMQWGKGCLPRGVSTWGVSAQGVSAWEVSALGSVSAHGGCLSGGMSATHTPADPPQTATEAGGTYPTGMHSCYHPELKFEAGNVFTPVCLFTAG